MGYSLAKTTTPRVLQLCLPVSDSDHGDPLHLLDRGSDLGIRFVVHRRRGFVHNDHLGRFQKCPR
jgi:hypothetical protein